MTIEKVRTLFDGTAHYRQTTPLDGVIFVLHFDLNSRDDNWYLSVHDNDDLPIRGLVGRKVVVNYALQLRAYTDGRPLGQLITVSDTQGDPGLLDLGNGVILTYVPEAEAVILAAGGTV